MIMSHDIFITIASCTLVMDTADRVSCSSFQTGPQSPIHLLFHLGISSLYRTQITIAGIITLYLQHTHTQIDFRLQLAAFNKAVRNIQIQVCPSSD